jgi:hypothetical protein
MLLRQLDLRPLDDSHLRAALGVVGLCWADRLPLKTEIASITKALFMFTPEKNSKDG